MNDVVDQLTQNGILYRSGGINGTPIVYGTPKGDFLSTDNLDKLAMSAPRPLIIVGGAGSDLITGSDFDDTLIGGLGDDIFKPGGGNDYVDGGDKNIDTKVDGFDTVDYSDASSPIIIAPRSAEDQEKGRWDILDDGYGGHDTLVSIEHIIGTGLGDTLKLKSGGAGSGPGFVDTIRQFAAFLNPVGSAEAAEIDLGGQTDADGHSPRGHGDIVDASGLAGGVVVDLRKEGSEFAQDMAAAPIPNVLGFNPAHPKRLAPGQFAKQALSELGHPGDVRAAGDQALDIEDVEGVTGTSYDDLIVGADAVYTGDPDTDDDVIDAAFDGYDIDGGAGDDTIVVRTAADQPDSVVTGGAGDDQILVTGKGDPGTVFGGTGRDLIIDLAKGGKVYGDTVDGLDPVTGQKLADTDANADVFWWAPGVAIMDAQYSDRLVFQGMALAGGGRNPAYLATAASLPFGLGGVIGRWGEALDAMRELTPVLLGTDAVGRAPCSQRRTRLRRSPARKPTVGRGRPINEMRLRR